MRKSTYWKADCLTDSDAYSIRCRTKKEVIAELEERGLERGNTWDHGKCWVDDNGHAMYGRPKKIEIVYTDLMDLICELKGECGYDY